MGKLGWFWVLLAGCGPWLYGCTATLGGALEAFQDGRLPAAASELRALEPEIARRSPNEQARYALYRGLTELGLGNAGVAEGWLHAAWQADTQDPHCFDAGEHGALLAAWRSLGRLPGESGRAVQH